MAAALCMPAGGIPISLFEYGVNIDGDSRFPFDGDPLQGGVDVLADAYPYTAYSTGLTIFMPAWAASGGWEAASERLRDASQSSVRGAGR